MKNNKKFYYFICDKNRIDITLHNLYFYTGSNLIIENDLIENQHLW